MALIPSYDYSLFSTDAMSPLDSWGLGAYNEFLSSDPVSAVNNALSSIASVAQPVSYTYSPTAGAIAPFAASSIPSAIQGFTQPSGSNITIYATGGDADQNPNLPYTIVGTSDSQSNSGYSPCNSTCKLCCAGVGALDPSECLQLCGNKTCAACGYGGSSDASNGASKNSKSGSNSGNGILDNIKKALSGSAQGSLVYQYGVFFLVVIILVLLYLFLKK